MRRILVLAAFASIALVGARKATAREHRQRPEPVAARADAKKASRDGERPARVRFGFVERRRVQLWAVELVLGEARRCREWPTPRRDRGELTATEVRTAGCRMRRHEGSVSVTLVDAAGRREPLPPLRTDDDGRLFVVITELDAAARFAGLGGLRSWASVELGRGAWAGHIDLRRLHGFLADWHLRWVQRGRGAPGLFAITHPEHPGADEARALAVEALIARQREDFAALRAGKLSAQQFLARYPWSPFRRDVERIAASRSALP